jgi:branched-chain amino acid transport system substrate-binding protein
MFSAAMFDFLDGHQEEEREDQDHRALPRGHDLRHRLLQCAAEARWRAGYKVAADIKYRANTPSVSAEVQQLRAANADVQMPSSCTTDAILLVKGHCHTKPILLASSACRVRARLRDSKDLR